MAWNNGGKVYHMNSQDVRSEPQDIKYLICQSEAQILNIIPTIFISGKLSVYNLLALRGLLRYQHSLTRLRSDIAYNAKLKKMFARLDELEKNLGTMDNANKNYFLDYFNLLMDWKDLQTTTFEKFSLVPAEDIDYHFPELPISDLQIKV